MIVIFLLIALLQDGPIATAPRSPAPAVSESDETAEAHDRQDAEQDGPRSSGRVVWNVAPGGIVRPPLLTREECRIEANRPAGQSEFNCMATEQAQQPEGRDGRSGTTSTDTSNAGVPTWALTDTARWETSQCGATSDEACRRQARNRLAMARAGLATDTPAERGTPAPAQNCRMVMQRSDTGFGGSLTRVCGDGAAAAAEAALDRLESTLRPTVEPCDRPASLESQDAWIARCRALPQR